MIIVQLADLQFQAGGSDKVYHVALKEALGGYVVDFAYGRRHSALTYGTKTSAPVSLEKAQSIFAKLVAEKTGKGYIPAPGISGKVFEGQDGKGSNLVVEAVAKMADEKNTGILPQLLTAINEEEVERLIEDPRWGAQEKKDGRRQFAWSTAEGGCTGINRKGFIVPLSPAVASSLDRIGLPILIDGEAIGDVLYVFGLLEYNLQDLRKLPYKDSYQILLEALEGYLGEGLEIVPLAVTVEDKRSLYKRLKKDKKEGIVFKLLAAPYTPGRPSSGGPQRKRKFYESASLVVLDINDQRSVKMGLYREDDLQAPPYFVGNVTIPPNFDIPAKGYIIEVRYLYAYKVGCLFQPNYLGVRDDIDLQSCTDAQLKYVCTESEAA